MTGVFASIKKINKKRKSHESDSSGGVMSSFTARQTFFSRLAHAVG